MKILETQSAALTNHEVTAHLTRLLSKPSSSRPPNLTAILKDTSAYLLSHQTDSASPIPPTIDDKKIRLLTQQLKEYKLEKGEVLTMVNLLPKEEDVGLLDCVVEELDERLGEERQRELLGMVGRVVGAGAGEVNGVGDGTTDGEGEVGNNKEREPVEREPVEREPVEREPVERRLR
ncbi:MAG: hypothetical protein Q9208_008732 [Pyrenodesmia sp. 3 TL-2023]